MTRQEMKQTARKQLSGNWGIAIGAWLLSSIIISMASSITFGLSFWFTGVMTFGLTGIYMYIIREGSAKLETLFSGFSNFINSFLAGLLQTLFIFLWTLLFIVPGIVKSYSYAMTFYILNDNPEMSGNDAITASREMMKGHKGELFLLDLSFIGWYILCGLTLGILSFYVVPYVQATKAAFYESLKKENDPDVGDEGTAGFGYTPTEETDTTAEDTVTEL